MKPGIAWAVGLALAGMLLTSTVQGQDSNSPQASPPSDQNVFILGGRFHTGYFGDSLAIFADHYEDNFFAGVGYQNFLYHYGELRAGVEVGLGVRFGESQPTAELWSGFVARYDGFHLGDLQISPALTAGFSLTSGEVGSEAQRSQDGGKTYPLLYYLGPEIAVSTRSNPNLEFIARVQHRSGGYGTIGRIDASNALTIGMRYKF